MEWRGEGVVIGVRKHGETSVILELFTAEQGRHLGLVLGGRSRRLRPLLQPGNGVAAIWRARVEEHLGTFAVEALQMRAGRIMQDPSSLHALNHLCGLSRLLPERDSHPALYRRLIHLLDLLGDPLGAGRLLVEFEIALLADLGFGLDLDQCAATGSREDLAFVSPRTGRAISRVAGEPYQDRIIALPAFLVSPETDQARVGTDDILAGFQLTEYFLVRHVFAPRGLALPQERRAYLAAFSAATI